MNTHDENIVETPIQRIPPRDAEFPVIRESSVWAQHCCCAECGYEYTRQFAVEAFFRPEDSDEGVFVRVSPQGTHEIPGEINPSRRRQGLRILLDCENCDYITALEIWQHKGMTPVEGRVVGFKKDGHKHLYGQVD